MKTQSGGRHVVRQTTNGPNDEFGDITLYDLKEGIRKEFQKDGRTS
jgi:hypothetical protein